MPLHRQSKAKEFWNNLDNNRQAEVKDSRYVCIRILMEKVCPQLMQPAKKIYTHYQKSIIEMGLL